MKHETTVFVESPICSAKTWSRLTGDQREKVRQGVKDALARSIASLLLRDGHIEFIEGVKHGDPHMQAHLTILTDK